MKDQDPVAFSCLQWIEGGLRYVGPSLMAQVLQMMQGLAIMKILLLLGGQENLTRKLLGSCNSVILYHVIVLVIDCSDCVSSYHRFNKV